MNAKWSRFMIRNNRFLQNRLGAVNPVLATLGGFVVAVILLVLLLPRGERQSQREKRPLVILAAAGLRAPLEEILQQYHKEMGVETQVQYGGSNLLLNQLKVNKFENPDLYLAADSFYTERAINEGLAAEVIPLARQEPVIAYRRGAQPATASWEDLLSKGVRWSLADPEQTAVGRATRKLLQTIPGHSGLPDGSNAESLWKRLETQTTQAGVFKATVNDVANDIKIGAVDVGIVWSSTVANPEYRDHLVAIRFSELPETASLANIYDEVSVAVLTVSSRPTEALRLARFIGAADRGLPVFKAAGLTPLEGDVWSPVPEITFFCGAVNRRAIEPVLETFQKREGVVVNTVFDGCGILTSRMGTMIGQKQSAGFPDVYMACDRYYLDNVKDWFQEDVDVSKTEIVLVVPKGSQKVASIEDLVKPGVRVSLGEPDQCTIGALTRRLLNQAGIYEKLKEKQLQTGEVVIEKSSSALIVPDVLTGHVDAAIAYRNDVMTHGDAVDVIAIDSPFTLAIQPLSIARNSQHKQLVRRLYRQVEQAEKQFESVGFDFLLGTRARSR